MRFDEAFERVIGHEGKYSNHPADNGGETMYGITAKVARDCGYVGAMKDLSLESAKSIYREKYWDAMRCDDLPKPADEFAFDFAVNSGVGTAAKALQRAVGALPDGRVGDRTVVAARQRKGLEIVRLMFVERALLFARHPDRDVFGNGWFARLFDKTAQAVKETA